MRSRKEIAESAALKLSSANLRAIPVMVGMDGFVDEIIDVVDKRQSHLLYDRMHTISQFGEKISAASGKSANFELVVKQQKLGGNGPIMANALASMGFVTTYVGNLGNPVHPVFQDFATRAEVLSIAEPAHTNALEFLDGKIMLGNLTSLGEITWDRILSSIGREKILAVMNRSMLLGLVNWTMLPHLTAIWRGILTDILPNLSPAPRRVFIDLADPEKRLIEDLRDALDTLTRMNEKVHVILGLNLSEAQQVANALGLPRASNPEAAITQYAARIREKLNLGTVVVHPRKGAAAANKSTTAEFAGPFVQTPKISTGAGDHFNAGFVAGQLLGFDLDESLAVGVATSGYYVRNAQSPSAANLATFLQDLPAPQL